MVDQAELREVVDQDLLRPFDDAEALEFDRANWGQGIEAQRAEALMDQGALPTSAIG